MGIIYLLLCLLKVISLNFDGFQWAFINLPCIYLISISTYLMTTIVIIDKSTQMHGVTQVNSVYLPAIFIKLSSPDYNNIHKYVKFTQKVMTTACNWINIVYVKLLFRQAFYPHNRYLGTTYFLLQANWGIAIGSLALKIKLKPDVYNLHFFNDSTDVDVVKKWQENRSAQEFFFFAHERTFTRQSSLYPFLVHKVLC